MKVIYQQFIIMLMQFYQYLYNILQLREYKKEKWMLVGNAHGIEGPWYITNKIWDSDRMKV